MTVKLVITETKTYSTSGTEKEENETGIREARGVNRGLGLLVTSLVAKAEELRELEEEIGLDKAYEKAKEEMPPGSPTDRSIYIDFSNNIPESQIDKIISLESEWWGVTLTKESYAESGKWGAQWVFVVDGTDWRTFMKNLEASRGKKITETHRGYHVGEGYPYEEEDEKGEKKETTYRGYSYINWRMCVRAAEVAFDYKGNTEAVYAQMHFGGDSWAFLKNNWMRNEVLDSHSDIWNDAPEKIAAWIINHELSHGIYRKKEEEVADIHDVMPFDADIQGLEILFYYTGVGIDYLNETYAEDPEKDPNLFLDFTGGKRIKRKKK